MRFSLIVAVFVCLICSQMSTPQSSDAQVVGKAIHDYWLDKPFQYKPSDPWVRGKIFQIHTGHYGRFYNCDKEECKRNSPYICWKTHYEKDIPPRRGFWGGIKEDLYGVKQRIRDGAGDCCPNNCDCADCQQAQSATAQSCNCAECRRSSQTNATIASNEAPQALPKTASTEKTAVTRQPIQRNGPRAESAPDKTPAPRFGLVSGRTLENRTLATQTASTQPSVKKPSTRVAQRQTIKDYVQGVFQR